jgi:hypothetical protein
MHIIHDISHNTFFEKIYIVYHYALQKRDFEEVERAIEFSEYQQRNE